MNTTFETIKQFFSEDEWFFIDIEDQDMLRLRMNHWGENGRFSCQAEFNEKQQIFYFFSYRRGHSCPWVFQPLEILVRKFVYISKIITW